jgi:hypothetical protein
MDDSVGDFEDVNERHYDDEQNQSTSEPEDRELTPPPPGVSPIHESTPIDPRSKEFRNPDNIRPNAVGNQMKENVAPNHESEERFENENFYREGENQKKHSDKDSNFLQMNISDAEKKAKHLTREINEFIQGLQIRSRQARKERKRRISSELTRAKASRTRSRLATKHHVPKMENVETMLLDIQYSSERTVLYAYFLQFQRRSIGHEDERSCITPN